MKEINLIKTKDCRENLTLDELTKTYYGVLLTMDGHKYRCIVHYSEIHTYQFICWYTTYHGQLTSFLNEHIFHQKELYKELCENKIFVFDSKKELFKWFVEKER